MLKSENAYLPSNARFISNFHVCAESIALAFLFPSLFVYLKVKHAAQLLHSPSQERV